jgi:hypothetical protein
MAIATTDIELTEYELHDLRMRLTGLADQLPHREAQVLRELLAEASLLPDSEEPGDEVAWWYG